MPAVGGGERDQQHGRREGAQQIGAEILHDAHGESAPLRRHRQRGDGLRDGRDAAVGQTHQQPRSQQHQKRGGQPAQEGTQRERDRGHNQVGLAAAAFVGRRPDQQGGDGPCKGEGGGGEAHLGIRQPQVRLDEGHDEIEGIPVEKQDAEIQAQQGNHTRLVEAVSRPRSTFSIRHFLCPAPLFVQLPHLNGCGSAGCNHRRSSAPPDRLLCLLQRWAGGALR